MGCIRISSVIDYKDQGSVRLHIIIFPGLVLLIAICLCGSISDSCLSFVEEGLQLRPIELED